VVASAIAAHSLARATAVVLMTMAPAASTDGLGASTTRALSKGLAMAGVVAGIAIAATATGWWVLPFGAAGFLGTAAVGWLAMRKIGGITGDVLGASEQVVECLILVTATGLASRSALWWAS